MRLASFVLVLMLSGCLGDLDSSLDPSDGDPSDANPARDGSSAPADPSPSPGEANAPQDPTSTGSPGNETPTTPEPMHWDGGVTIGVEVGGPYATCQGPFHSCDMRPFRIKGTFDVTATLSWEVAANDLDLFLYRETGDRYEFVSDDGINGPDQVAANTSQVLHYAELPPGDYRLFVAARHAVLDAYKLDAVFH